MTLDSAISAAPSAASRPVGLVQPTHEHAVRALKAIAGLRHDDAQRHLAVIPDAPLLARSWKLLLRGLLSADAGRLREAEPLLLPAAALAFIEAATAGDTAEPSRVAATALHHLGRVYRREERVEDATRTHLAAYQLRDSFGSAEELWASACELGLDADVARRFDDASQWHQRAVELAAECTPDPARCAAVAWTNLANSRTEAGRPAEAVHAAEHAREAWCRHDVTAVEAALADMRLGDAMLRHGVALLEDASPLAPQVLRDAAARLAEAEIALAAFGPGQARDAVECRERAEHASQLAETAVVPD